MKKVSSNVKGVSFLGLAVMINRVFPKRKPDVLEGAIRWILKLL
jgi:hypothetical protein